MDVSIIIVNWNTCDISRDCLRSIAEQTKGIAYEVIFVDNASSDDSVEMVKNEFPQIVLVSNSENKGFAAANNQGMKVARGRYVLLLNSDTLILDNAIAKTVAYADKHPEAGVVGCRVLNQDRTLQPTCFMYPSLLNLFLSSTYLYKLLPRSRFCGREHMSWWDRNNEMEVDVITGCFMLVRQEAIKDVGLMDESFFMYAEETDWCYRFQKAGWKNFFSPEGEIIHLGGASSKKVRPEMIIRLRKSILQFIKKHRSVFVYQASKVCMVLWFIFRVPYWFLVGLLSTNHRKEARTTCKAYWQGAIQILFNRILT